MISATSVSVSLRPGGFTGRKRAAVKGQTVGGVDKVDDWSNPVLLHRPSVIYCTVPGEGGSPTYGAYIINKSLYQSDA